MTILVTGGTGLVGTRLLKRLANSGSDCRALVRPGKQVPEGVAPVQGDLQEPESLKTAVNGVSAIVHLAAVFRTQDEDAIWKANLDGTKNLIAAVKAQSPQARFIMASTILVYNNDIPHPAREDDAAEPELAYPASKVAAEKELRNSGLTWNVLRFPFVYGDKDGHLESATPLLARMKRHPAQRFSLIHHQDIATAVELALSGVMDGHVVNIADDGPTTVYEMAHIIGANYEPSAEPLANPWMGQVDVTLAHSLGFKPTILTIQQANREGKM